MSRGGRMLDRSSSVDGFDDLDSVPTTRRTPMADDDFNDGDYDDDFDATRVDEIDVEGELAGPDIGDADMAIDVDNSEIHDLFMQLGVDRSYADELAAEGLEPDDLLHVEDLSLIIPDAQQREVLLEYLMARRNERDD